MQTETAITDSSEADSPQEAILELPFHDRGEALANFAREKASEPTNEKIRDAACEVAIHDGVGTNELAGIMPFDEVFNHLAQFARYYEGFNATGPADINEELMEGLARNDFPDVGHSAYYWLQTLYFRLTLEEIEEYTGELPPFDN